MTLFLVEIRVRDLDRSIAWYGRALGLNVTLRDNQGGYALLGAGSASIAFKVATESPADRRAVRITFQVADLETEFTRIVREGIAVAEPAANLEEGFREIRLADPDGTPITLFAWDQRIADLGIDQR